MKNWLASRQCSRRRRQALPQRDRFPTFGGQSPPERGSRIRAHGALITPDSAFATLYVLVCGSNEIGPCPKACQVRPHAFARRSPRRMLMDITERRQLAAQEQEAPAGARGGRGWGWGFDLPGQHCYAKLILATVDPTRG